ncbi:hypothetical protein K469DRAFT_797546, partial [Zopfia rhizophila CBS 207.26]
HLAPALGSVDSDYKVVRYAGLQDLNSPWRGEPRPELEEAWDNVTWEVGEIPVSKEEALRSGLLLDPNTLVRFPEEYGGQIYTSVEWNHHLHCLNMIRKFIRFDYYKDKEHSFSFPPEETINHLDHCVDMLRQHVMCTADQGLIFSHWVEGYDHKHVDFNTQHKCRNFRSALEWAMERAKHPKMEELVRHPGAVDLKDYPENLTRHGGGYEGNFYYQP